MNELLSYFEHKYIRECRCIRPRVVQHHGVEPARSIYRRYCSNDKRNGGLAPWAPVALPLSSPDDDVDVLDRHQAGHVRAESFTSTGCDGRCSSTKEDVFAAAETR